MKIIPNEIVRQLRNLQNTQIAHPINYIQGAVINIKTDLSSKGFTLAALTDFAQPVTPTSENIKKGADLLKNAEQNAYFIGAQNNYRSFLRSLQSRTEKPKNVREVGECIEGIQKYLDAIAAMPRKSQPLSPTENRDNDRLLVALKEKAHIRMAQRYFQQLQEPHFPYPLSSDVVDNAQNQIDAHLKAVGKGYEALQDSNAASFNRENMEKSLRLALALSRAHGLSGEFTKAALNTDLCKVREILQIHPNLPEQTIFVSGTKLTPAQIIKSAIYDAANSSDLPREQSLRAMLDFLNAAAQPQKTAGSAPASAPSSYHTPPGYH